MPVFALLIISKAGSLIYHRTFPTASSGSQPANGTLGLPGTTSLTTNDYLILAGTFHGVHAITKSLTPKFPANSASSEDTPLTAINGASRRQYNTRPPNPDLPITGIESLESSFFKLSVFQSLTGTKFLLFTDPSMPNTDGLIRGIYDRYADHVCKNPFWPVDNPIRLDGWDRALTQFLFRR